MKLFTSLPVGVLFIDSYKIQLYVPTHQGIFSLDLPTSYVRDLEVVNGEELKKYITVFIEQNKIPPVHLLITLSNNMLFEQEFPDTQSGQPQLEEVPVFLDSIPFQNISTKTFKFPKTTVVIATNRDFYEAVKDPFESRGFVIEAVAPIKVLSKEFTTVTVLNKELAKQIVKYANAVKQNALEIYYEKKSEETEEQREESKKNIKLFAMIGVLVILLLILGFLMYKTFVLDPQAERLAKLQTQTDMQPTIAPTAVPTETATASAIFIDKNTRIQVLHSTENSSSSAILVDSLKRAGFENVISETSTQATTTKTRIIFLPSISTEIRDKITQVIEESYKDPTIQENPQSTSDVIVIIERKQ